MSRKRDFRRLARGLRFRLAVSYALLFTLLLTGLALIFRENLARALDTQIQEELTGDWGAMKGYMRIERVPELANKFASAWYYDKDDPDETTIVLDLRKIYMVADQNGNPIPDAETHEASVSTAYDDIGVDKPEDIRKKVAESVASSKPKVYWAGSPDLQRRSRQNPQRRGSTPKATQRPTTTWPSGTSYADNEKVLHRYTWIFAGVIPGALILGSLLGYFMAGRALTPVLAVAQAAQRISGLNLSMRIPTRDAGDELDYLILTFNRMIERLEASFQQIRQFSTDVSHELRTPITGIRGQLEVALFNRQDGGPVSRGDVQFPAGYRPAFADCARAVAAFAGRSPVNSCCRRRASISAKSWTTWSTSSRFRPRPRACASRPRCRRTARPTWTAYRSSA